MGLALSIVSHVNPRSSALAQRARKALHHGPTCYARAETIYAGTTEVQLDIIAATHHEFAEGPLR